MYKKPARTRSKFEEDNQLKNVAFYIRLKYPKLSTFWVDQSGLKMSKTQAMMSASMRGICSNIDSTFRTPDLIIDKPMHGFHGLRIEFKKEGERLLIVRASSMREVGQFCTRHLEEQFVSIHELIKDGYYATFSTGYDDTTRLIDRYLSPDPIEEIDCIQIYNQLCIEYEIKPNWNYFKTLIVH
jgi:hypothetical protein